MNNITFKQFIYTYNFRCVDATKNFNDNAWEDTLIIRIYPHREDFLNIEWFEFGVYDFSNKECTWEICERVLSKDILDSYVESISYDGERDNVVTICLTKEKHYIS